MAHPSSVAVALVMTMIVSCSNCVMSKSIASITTGNSTAAASSTWCNGNMVDGQCMLVADAAYGGGEHSDLNMNVADLEVLEYYDLGESITKRVLVTGKVDIYLSLDRQKPAYYNVASNKRYLRQNCDLHNRAC